MRRGSSSNTCFCIFFTDRALLAGCRMCRRSRERGATIKGKPQRLPSKCRCAQNKESAAALKVPYFLWGFHWAAPGCRSRRGRDPGLCRGRGWAAALRHRGRGACCRTCPLGITSCRTFDIFCVRFVEPALSFCRERCRRLGEQPSWSSFCGDSVLQRCGSTYWAVQPSQRGHPSRC